VVHSEGAADPWVVRHGGRVGHKWLATSILNGIHKCSYNDRSQVSDIVSLPHVSLDRYNIAWLETVEPSGMLENLTALDSSGFQKAS
jgi:hypothetical protein